MLFYFFKFYDNAGSLKMCCVITRYVRLPFSSNFVFLWFYSVKHSNIKFPYILHLNIKKQQNKNSNLTSIFIYYSLLPITLFPCENIQYSFLCLSSLLIMKVSPRPFQADWHPLWHCPGLCSIWACSHEGNESFWEGQHVFPNVADDQPKQWIRE